MGQVLHPDLSNGISSPSQMFQNEYIAASNVLFRIQNRLRYKYMIPKPAENNIFIKGSHTIMASHFKVYI